MFSSPYGDGTNSNRVEFRISVFAPLRGWYLQVPHKHGDQRVFAPLRGWYRQRRRNPKLFGVFAPLRGWYTKYITEDRKMEELNA